MLPELQLLPLSAHSLSGTAEEDGRERGAEGMEKKDRKECQERSVRGGKEEKDEGQGKMCYGFCGMNGISLSPFPPLPPPPPPYPSPSSFFTCKSKFCLSFLFLFSHTSLRALLSVPNC